MVINRKTQLMDRLVGRMVPDLINRLADRGESLEHIEDAVDVVIETAARVAGKTIAASNRHA